MKQIIFIFTSVLYSLTYGQICFPNDCMFNGKLYLPGDVLDTSCFQLMCDGNRNWQFTNEISQNCDVCYVSNDPHFKTFDNNYYDWHGRCKYALSQPACPDLGNSQDPPYGIFGDFDECSPGSIASCLTQTTYKVDAATNILITHTGSVIIQINGYSVTSITPAVPSDCGGILFPVVFWQEGPCVRIIGLDYSIHACPDHMFIYTNNSHQNQIGGLCGNYNGDLNDDYMTRNCYGPTSIPDFANSWKTTDQPGDCVNSVEWVNKRSIENTDFDEECNDSQYRAECEIIVGNNVANCGSPIDESDIQETIDNCVKDCCAEQNRCDEWRNVAGEFMCNIGKNSEMMRGGGSQRRLVG